MRTLYLIFMSLSVFILTSVLLIRQNTAAVFGDHADLYTITVTLNKNISPEEMAAIVEKIKNLDTQIKSAALISPQQQLQDVQSALPSYSKGLFEDEEITYVLNPLVEVLLTAEADLSTLSLQIKSLSGVEDSSVGNVWAEKIKNLFKTLNIILNTVFILFFIILSFLITVLVRNYLIDAKDRISLFALLGAMPLQAFKNEYLSIMNRTLLAYFIGLFAASGLAYFIKNKLTSNLNFTFISERLDFLTLESLALLLSGLMLNLALSYFLSYQYILKEYYHHES